MFNYPIGSNKPKMQAKPPQDKQMAPAAEVAEESPEQVAQQHGPANQIQIEHEHEMGAHHVHSVHPDGHEHHSDHGSAEEAHEHAKKLAGIGGEEKSEPEGGDDWDNEPEG